MSLLCDNQSGRATFLVPMTIAGSLTISRSSVGFAGLGGQDGLSPLFSSGSNTSFNLGGSAIIRRGRGAGATGSLVARLGPVINIKASRNVLVQVQNAFDNRFYVTPFGGAAGQLEISFIDGKACGTSDRLLDSAKEVYEEWRFTGGRPLSIDVGGFYNGSGLLYGFSSGITSESRLPSATFTFTLLDA